MPSAPPRNGYRIPSALRDLVLVDFLELTGSTTAAAAQLALSQPSVSRRYRALAVELGLERRLDGPVGRRYGDTDWLALLRRGVNRHRLACGVVRVGGPAALGAALRGCRWAEWVSLGRAALNHWPQLLRHELLDVVALPQAGQGSAQSPADIAVVELRAKASDPLRLACRNDPDVLGIVGALMGDDPARLLPAFERS